MQAHDLKTAPYTPKNGKNVPLGVRIPKTNSNAPEATYEPLNGNLETKQQTQMQKPLKSDLEQLQKLIRTVSEITGVEPEVILGRSRRQPASFARQLCMAIGYRTTYMSLNQIGECFDGRDHGTVIYAMKAIDKASNNKTTAPLIREVLEAIK